MANKYGYDSKSLTADTTETKVDIGTTNEPFKGVLFVNDGSNTVYFKINEDANEDNDEIPVKSGESVSLNVNIYNYAYYTKSGTSDIRVFAD